MSGFGWGTLGAGGAGAAGRTEDLEMLGNGIPTLGMPAEGSGAAGCLGDGAEPDS